MPSRAHRNILLIVPDSVRAASCSLYDTDRETTPFLSDYADDRWTTDDEHAIQSNLPVRWEFAFHSGAVPMWHLHGLEALYQGGIRQDDAIVRHLVDGLAARNCHDETLVVICGDHGEWLGEPGQLSNEPPAIGHIVPMQETLLHVPLVVSAPGQCWRASNR